MKLATQMLPLPSTATLHGPIRLLALIGERGLIRPSGPISVMLLLAEVRNPKIPGLIDRDALRGAQSPTHDRSRCVPARVDLGHFARE